jgi:taste receptor type 2
MLTLILSVELIVGNLGNGFIALVNCIAWARRRKISWVDQILTALAISRIGLLCSALTNMLIFSLHPPILVVVILIRIITILWAVTSHFSIWLATSLSIFYFLKIANLSNSIFLYLKWRIKKVISVTLMVSLVLLFVNILLMNTSIDSLIDGSKRNMSYISSSKNYTQFPRLLITINIIFLSTPFTISLLACLLLILSLWKHHKKIQHNGIGSRDANTKAYVKALQTVIAFLLLYVICFLSVLIQIWHSDFLEKSLLIFFCRAAIIAFPSGHSYVLILTNTHLRQAALSVLWWLRCRCKDAKPQGT